MTLTFFVQRLQTFFNFVTLLRFSTF